MNVCVQKKIKFLRFKNISYLTRRQNERRRRKSLAPEVGKQERATSSTLIVESPSTETDVHQNNEQSEHESDAEYHDVKVNVPTKRKKTPDKAQMRVKLPALARACERYGTACQIDPLQQ